jgi:hypothetical protein
VGKTPAEQIALLRSWGNTALFGGYEDPELVEAAHAAGMKVFAEFPCFFGKRWWDEIPASRPVTHEGHLLEPEGWYYGVNPALPLVRRRRLAALEELLTEHAINGVWLDFIRWPCRWEGARPHLPRTSFDAGTLDRFRCDTGIEIPTDDAASAARLLLVRYEAEWQAWRCAQITTWVAEAKALLQRVRPAALLGLFGVPWRLSDHGGAILDVIGQDYRALAAYVDVFSPMVYHALCRQSVAWTDEVTAEIRSLTGTPVWPIIQSVDEPRPLSAEEYKGALKAVLDSPAADGVLVFTLQGALDAAKLAVTVGEFHRFELG